MRRLLPWVLTGPLALACGHIPHDLWTLTWKHARGWGLDPYLVAAVVWVESGYCTRAVGKAGEVGLGQFMPGTWKRVTGAPSEWRQHPEWALWATAKHLRELYLATGDWRMALVGYNAGLGAVRSGKIPASTQRYVEKVLAVYQRFRRVANHL
ncbi:MAG: lytic transglycosylase domain-containing protein [Thermus sp.]